MRIVEKLGQAGGPKNRERKKKEWDEKYGEGNWEVVYFYKDKIYTRDEALKQFYNESYYIYFKTHPNTTMRLCLLAGELYNPHAENTGGVDLQVPAVLEALDRLGRKLTGKERIAIGTWGSKFGKKYPPISHELSPFKIPLWCEPSISVEEFWQDYKYLAVKD